MSVATLLDEIATTLAQHEHQVRIRKLLFCACYNRWENDQSILANLEIESLLFRLYQQHTTLEKITETLYTVVQKLNRKTQYAQLANVIIEQVKPLYDHTPPPSPDTDNSEATQFLSSETTQFYPQFTPPSPLTNIAQSLDQHEQSLRIRKLLFCACYNQWENNIQPLLQLDLIELLKTLQSRHSSTNELSTTLYNIVGNLNRKVAYSQLANFIIEQLQGLYPTLEANSTQFLTPQPPSNTEFTPPNQDNSPPSPPSPDEMATEVIQNPISSPPNLNNPDDTTNYTQRNQTAYTEKTTVSQGNQTAAFLQTQLQTHHPSHKAYDPFEIRLEVMKYANPLRAKILSFSTLNHKFETTGNEWSSLRTQSFDQLLRQLYETYREFTYLEQNLYKTAQHLEAPDESQQAAEAIAQAMKPYYPLPS
ncbi:hypothetical protein PN462_03200 [Spirulina sp. CS-785/01]|uniref:hypothetical protein n=1 Tax=Spirulina sp. CS-785/01 TaxID=3021716 RepID=UPI00232CBFAF|nr:hypothetical protein [Spirulina sp. CS-785/01]MDB9312095.1 hypothetical protein [Spirulina sp. CS-785/01]